MSNIKMHDNEITIDVALLKRLLNSQFPEWSSLPVVLIKSLGTDNIIYRLGKNMLVRLPRIETATKYLENERIWLPMLAPHLPINIPSLIAVGKPETIYPWHWSIWNWIEGENAFGNLKIDHEQNAIDLATFLKSLHNIDTLGAPISPRGQPLITRDLQTRNAIQILQNQLNVKAITKIWQESITVHKWNKPSVWVHGDLLPTNIIVNQNKINGIIDFDLFGIGDPACDLIVAWSLFDKNSRKIFREKIECDDYTWIRGKGWALSIALVILPYYKNKNTILIEIAEKIISEILSEF